MLNRIIYDPFNDGLDTEQHFEKIHIKTKQRTKTKSITIIENIPEKIDLKLFLKKLKYTFHCSGSIQQNYDDDSKFIQLSGDHRELVKNFLLKNSIVKESNIVMHGY